MSLSLYCEPFDSLIQFNVRCELTFKLGKYKYITRLKGMFLCNVLKLIHTIWHTQFDIHWMHLTLTVRMKWMIYI